MSASPQRLSDSQYEQLQVIIRRLTGINMTSAKRTMVTRRVHNRMLERDIDSVDRYLQLLDAGDPFEIELFSNAVTTNLTSFFREHHHFEFLEQRFFPAFLQGHLGRGNTLRLWSAGCSTGEEPYSIAMSMLENLPNIARYDARVLATDIDSQVLAACARGHYNEARIAKVPAALKARYFEQSVVDGVSTYVATKALRQRIVFNQLNLLERWPMSGPFDLIFCRNVIIYFDKDVQRELVNRYADALTPDGILIVGHSESLMGISDRFRLLGKTVYARQS